MPASEKYNDSRMVLLQDSILSVLASLLALLLLRWLNEAVLGFTTIVLRWLGCALVASLIGFLVTGSYRFVRRYPTIRLLGHVVLAIVVKEILLAVALLLHVIPAASAMNALALLLADTILTSVFLLYIRLSARLFSTDGDEEVNFVVGKKNVLVAGTGLESLKLANEADRSGIYNVVGLLTSDQALVGRVIDDRVVYFCQSMHDVDALQWRLGGIDAILFPNEPGEGGEGTMAETTLSDHPQHDGMSLGGRMVKRSFDAAASALLLILFSPLIAICAAAVKLEDGGPVLFAQERIGQHGRPFNIYKFRSMRVDAEAADSPQLYSGEKDPRLTRVGRFLRAHHLDELPQLWNVLRGDMSFIGYRPERQFYIGQIMARNPRYRYLYQIRPGVTSYATLYNGYTDTLEKMLTRLDLDLYYLRNRSVWFDLKVLGLTFLSIVVGRKF